MLNLNFPDVTIYYGNYSSLFSFCWKHGESLWVVFFFIILMQRIEAQRRTKEIEEKKDLMSKHRHDNTDISFYFLPITLKLFPTNILSNNSSLESALNVCCFVRRGRTFFSLDNSPASWKSSCKLKSSSLLSVPLLA